MKRIHRRKKPIMQTILPGTEVHNSVGLLGEANVLNLLKLQVPGVKDVFFTHGGCGFYGAVVQITQTRAGWAKQAILAAFAAFPPLKSVTVVDDDVNIYDPTDVEWAMTTRMDADKGIMIFRDIFGHGLNPSFPNYLGNKVGYDANTALPAPPGIRARSDEENVPRRVGNRDAGYRRPKGLTAPKRNANRRVHHESISSRSRSADRLQASRIFQA